MDSLKDIDWQFWLVIGFLLVFCFLSIFQPVERLNKFLRRKSMEKLERERKNSQKGFA